MFSTVCFHVNPLGVNCGKRPLFPRFSHSDYSFHFSVFFSHNVFYEFIHKSQPFPHSFPQKLLDIFNFELTFSVVLQNDLKNYYFGRFINRSFISKFALILMGVSSKMISSGATFFSTSPKSHFPFLFESMIVLIK